MNTRHILHVDCNKFYASVECCLHPELRGLPVAVGGDEEKRHGIILTKNEIAARYGLVTGEPLWAARQKCPSLVIRQPDFAAYSRFSRMVRHILEDYTDRIEPFGLDEAWMDLTDIRSDPVTVAHTIRRRIREELGITVSIGVSFTKSFAKLGSDYKKPDAVTVFSKSNYRNTVWPLPIGNLLYVGRATNQKLAQRYLFTIGDVARADPALLRALLGKCGDMLHAAANGWDDGPVIPVREFAPVQSVSNGMTAPRDLTDEHDVKIVLYAMAESVGRRLREQHLIGKTVELHLRDCELNHQSYRVTSDHYIQSTTDIAQTALTLFRDKYVWHRPLRSLTVGITGLEPENIPQQMDMLDSARRDKQETLDKTVDHLKSRFGETCVQRAVILENPALAGIREPVFPPAFVKQ